MSTAENFTGSTEGRLNAASARDWDQLVQEVRAFERRIGFKDTRNFLTFEQEKEGFPFCGYVSRLYLPYSYEDPAMDGALLMLPMLGFVEATEWNRAYARVYRCPICDWFHLTSQRTNWELAREAS